MCLRRLVATLCLFCCLGASEPIRVGVDEWTTLNPLLLAQDTDNEAIGLIFDRLVALDAQGNFVPELLESWTILKGGREVILNLRPGLTWHDGSPIEAEDLVFTWRTLQLPRVRAIGDTLGGVSSLDSLVAEGPLRVRIRLARPRGTLLADLYSFIPVPRKHYQVGPKPATQPVNFLPVGSGPYRVLEQATTKHAFFVRWDGYKGVHPGIWPAFEYIDPTAEKAPAQAILAGRLHYATVRALPHYLARQGALGGGRLKAFSLPQAAFGAYFLNCDPKRSLLGELSLRQALAELVPWQDLARGRRFFPTRLATSFWPPESWAHDTTPRPLPQVARAISLLDGAGWRLGRDGIRRNAKGQELKLVFYEGVGSDHRTVAYQLAEAARAVGMRIDLRQVSFQVLIQHAAQHEGDLWSYGWATSLDPDGDSALFTLDGYRTHANVSAYLNPEIDQLFDEGRHTLDPVARSRIYKKISEIIWRDKPLIPFNYVIARILVDSRLQGVTFDSMGRSFGFTPGRRGWSLEGRK